MSLLALLFPPRCVLCQTRLRAADEAAICPNCAAIVRREYRQLSGVRVPGTDGAVAALQYKGLVREAMHRYKFRYKKGYYRWFAAHAATALAEQLAEWQPDVLTFVPVSFDRRRTRGYDQTELIARLISALTGVPCVPLLHKRPFQKRQSAQSRAGRRENVQHSFTLRKDAEVAGKRIVLIDDVLTTGATLTACAAVLCNAGAARIYALAVTKTP